MAKKAIKTDDDLIKALQDEPVMILVTRLTPIVNEVFKTLAAEFKSSIMKLVGETVKSKMKDLESWKGRIKYFNAKLTQSKHIIVLIT